MDVRVPIYKFNTESDKCIRVLVWTMKELPLMVVDDDEAIREVIETAVTAEGYSVVTAADGKEALDRLSLGLHPGVILLDLRMPGMNGRQFLELQKADARFSDIPVIIISGDMDACKEATCSGSVCLLKPIDLEQLLGVARRYCR